MFGIPTWVYVVGILIIIYIVWERWYTRDIPLAADIYELRCRGASCSGVAQELKIEPAVVEYYCDRFKSEHSLYGFLVRSAWRKKYPRKF